MPSRCCYHGNMSKQELNVVMEMTKGMMGNILAYYLHLMYIVF